MINHEHSLKLIDKGRWNCGGRHLVGGCKSGTDGCNIELVRYGCMECNFDLCSFCVPAYYDPPKENTDDNNNSNVNSSQTKKTKSLKTWNTVVPSP